MINHSIGITQLTSQIPIIHQDEMIWADSNQPWHFVEHSVLHRRTNKQLLANCWKWQFRFGSDSSVNTLTSSSQHLQEDSLHSDLINCLKLGDDFEWIEWIDRMEFIDEWNVQHRDLYLFDVFTFTRHFRFRNVTSFPTGCSVRFELTCTWQILWHIVWSSYPLRPIFLVLPFSLSIA